MQYKTLIPIALLAASAAAQTPPEWMGPAEAIDDNPVGKTYAAKFDDEKLTGSVTFTAGKGGEGVQVEVKIDGLAGQQGPFGYHIHDQPVPADGNCTGTKGHLDPYKRGQATPCDKSAPETCEVGDLAGKHGKIDDGVNTENSTDSKATVFEQSYTEMYASTKEGIGAFLGNRSIVIHAADDKKSRIVCANIELVEGDDEPTDGGDEPSVPSGYPVPSGTGKPGYPGCNGNCPYPTDGKPGHGYAHGTGHASGYPVPTGYPSAPHTNGTSSASSGGSGSGSGSGSATTAAPSPAGPSAPANEEEEEGSAATFGVSAGAIFGGLVALVMAL